MNNQVFQRKRFLALAKASFNPPFSPHWIKGLNKMFICQNRKSNMYGQRASDVGVKQ